MGQERERITIRPAGSTDTEALIGLLDQLGYQGSENFLAASLEALATSPADRQWVAERAGRVCGLLALHVTPILMLPQPMARVTAFCVDTAHRGHGIGRRLMDAAEAFARSQGCDRMELTCSARRTGAHAFYRRVGFEEHPKYFWKALA